MRWRKKLEFLEKNGGWEEGNWEVKIEKAVFEEVLQGVEGECPAL